MDKGLKWKKGDRDEKKKLHSRCDGGEELYGMSNDPNQWKNLAGNPEFSTLKGKLKKWLPKTNKEHFTGEK